MGMKAILAAMAMAVVTSVMPAHGQGYPNKPITMIVPAIAGGTADGIARLLAEGMRKRLNDTPIVFDYAPGASGLVGQQRAARSAGDGYTIFFGSSTIVLPMVTRPKQSVDMLNELIPLIRSTRSAYVLLASKDSGIKSVKDLVDRAKKKPGEIFYGIVGTGSTYHLMTEHIKSLLEIDITPVPYKGEAQVFSEILTNRIQLFLIATPHALIEQGAVPLGSTAEKQWPFFPPMPPLGDSIRGFDHYYAWSGLFLPKGTPPDIVAKLNAAARGALSDPEIIEKLAKYGVQAAGSTPEEFTEIIKQDLAMFRKVIDARKLTFED
jgi:tripartite-type tricarboxylate transporter receptor subunit TctC